MYLLKLFDALFQGSAPLLVLLSSCIAIHKLLSHLIKIVFQLPCAGGNLDPSCQWETLNGQVENSLRWTLH
jgi:hypothetical protein